MNFTAAFLCRTVQFNEYRLLPFELNFISDLLFVIDLSSDLNVWLRYIWYNVFFYSGDV